MSMPHPLHPRIAALRRGERWWPAEIALRGLGAALLYAGWRVALLARDMATQGPPHPAGAADLAVCAAVVVLLCTGLTLGFEGPGLLRDVPLIAWFSPTKGPTP